MLSNGGPLTANIVNNHQQLVLEFLAYPKPDSFSIQPFRPTTNTSNAVPSTLSWNCTTGVTSYRVTCTVMINDVTGSDRGMYFLYVDNDVGSTAVLFEMNTEGL
jgi:hypothetical protein